MTLTKEQVTRYSRHLLLDEVGRQGQEKLVHARVLLVGAGGLGCPAGQYLAAAGVGHLGIIDSDRVELSNLQRQVLHWTPDVGKLKVESAAEKIFAMNPNVMVQPYAERLRAENFLKIVEGYDLLIDGSDNFSTKFLVNDGCVLIKKPFLHAGILRFHGQMMLVQPGESACYRCVFLEAPPADQVPSCAEAGVIGAVAGVMGSLLAGEAIKHLLGLGVSLQNRLLSFDALEFRFREVPLKRNPDCPVCGQQPSIREIREEKLEACSFDSI